MSEVNVSYFKKAGRGQTFQVLKAAKQYANSHNIRTILVARRPASCPYFELVHYPLQCASRLEDVDAAVFDPLPPDEIDFALSQVSYWKTNFDYGLIGGYGGLMLEEGNFRFGQQRFMEMLALEPDLVEYFFDRVAKWHIANLKLYLDAVGEDIDAIVMADDLAGQKNLFFSREMYRKYIKPRHTRLFSFMKARTDAKLFYHCDGALLPILWDLRESGIDILNPLQKSAAGIDYAAIKKEYGAEISFWGAGVDTQRVFDQGTPEEVREDTRRNIETMAPGGGFVCTPIHNTQATVPPENYMAFWETLREYGVY